MLGSLGMGEILIIACIALLIFGPRQLPKFGKSIGETIRELKGIGKEISGEAEELRKTAESVLSDKPSGLSDTEWEAIKRDRAIRVERDRRS